MYTVQKDWLNIDIIWFLEIDYLGTTKRFATIQFDYTDNDKSYLYNSGLNDVKIEQSLSEVGTIKVTTDSIAIAITFSDINIAKNQINGKFLEKSVCRLGYVLIKNGEIQNNYVDRPIVYTGIVSSPVYGHPDKTNGYVEFSIENTVNIDKTPLLTHIIGSDHFIEDVSCTNALYVSPDWPTHQGLTEVQDIHRGKIIPFVFGELTQVQHSSGVTSGIPITPAYAIAYDPSATAKPVFYLLCGHVTNATSVKLYSNTGETDTANIKTFVNIDDRTLTYVEIPNTSSIPQSVAANDDREVWVEWTNGSAYPNPVDTTIFTGAGDLCLWLLSAVTDKIDYGAWAALKPMLNQYKFAGYVNDPKITILQWLQKNIIAYLPIHLINGVYGIKPVLSMFQSIADLQPRLTIKTCPSFTRNSAVVSDSDDNDITNVVTVRYAKNGVTDNYSTYVKISDVIPAASVLSSNTYIASQKSRNSIQRYGTKNNTIELDYVYNNLTAQRIAQDIIDKKSFMKKSIQYSVSLQYGYLELGDIIQITDAELGYINQKTQISQKIFDKNRWLITVKIDENPNKYNRNET